MKMANLMREYFEQPGHEQELNFSRIGIGPSRFAALPVVAKEKSWKLVKSPNRLMKTYEFDSFQFFMAFLDELLRYQESLQHHAKLTVEDRKVIVEIWTHDIDDVTELDHEYAKTCDNIYADTKDYTKSAR